MGLRVFPLLNEVVGIEQRIAILISDGALQSPKVLFFLNGYYPTPFPEILIHLIQSETKTSLQVMLM